MDRSRDVDEAGGDEPGGPWAVIDPDTATDDFRAGVVAHAGGTARPRRLHRVTLSCIGLGGAAGALARVALARVLPEAHGFPWATFLVNVSGAALVGLLVAVLPATTHQRYLRPLLVTGLCGGFTTFSTLAVEVDLRVRAHEGGLAAGYLVATLGAGWVAVLVGLWIGRGVAAKSGSSRTAAPPVDPERP